MAASSGSIGFAALQGTATLAGSLFAIAVRKP